GQRLFRCRNFHSEDRPRSACQVPCLSTDDQERFARYLRPSPHAVRGRLLDARAVQNVLAPSPLPATTSCPLRAGRLPSLPAVVSCPVDACERKTPPERIPAGEQ